MPVMVVLCSRAEPNRRASIRAVASTAPARLGTGAGHDGGELWEVDPACAIVFGDQQRRDQEAGQHEEEVDPDEAEVETR